MGMSRLCACLVWGLTLVLSATVVGADAPPIRWFLEAEDGEGLYRFPGDNEDAPGWYAHEANVRAGCGAPGRSYCAMLNESSAPDQRTLALRFPAPLPPGQYRLLVRTKGPIDCPQDQILHAVVGDAQTDFVWRRGERREAAAWLWVTPKPPTITVTKAADQLTLTATQFGGGAGFTALYHMIGRMICLDTVYLTNDLTADAPPANQEAVRNGTNPQDWGPRLPHPADDAGPSHYDTPAPKQQEATTPVLLAAFDGRRNWWPNSSFETGLDGWTATNAGRGCFHVFSDADLVTDRPFHGTRSLHVPGPQPLVGAPGYPLNPFSRLYLLKEAGAFTLSLYVRGGGPFAANLKWIDRKDVAMNRPNEKVAITLKGDAGPDWQRLSARGQLEAGEYALYCQSATEFWLDAIQLEPGEAATAYTPRAELEGGLRSGQLANIIYAEDQNWLAVWLHNSGAAERQAKLTYRMVDVRDQTVATGETPAITVGAGATVTQQVPLLPPLKGLFSVRFALAGRASPEGETVFLVMPRPAAGDTRHELGGNFPPSQGCLAVNARAGVRWMLTCKAPLFANPAKGPFPMHPAGVHPAPDKWNWADAEAAEVVRYGFHNVQLFWPRHTGLPWMEEPPAVPRPYRFGCAPTIPKLVPWQEHVAKVAAHYQDTIQQWCLDDETEAEWHLSHLAPFVQATSSAIHAATPKAKVGISCCPEATEELFQLTSPDVLDFCGGSSFDFNYWQSRYVRQLQQRYGKPWICYGVGARVPERSMFHTFSQYAPVYPKAVHMARQILMLLLVQDAKVAGVYTAVIRNEGSHHVQDKPLYDYDGTPLPWGASFSIIGTQLAEAVPLPEAELGQTGRYVHVFRIGNQVGAVTWATLVRSFDHHVRPAERELKQLNLPCPRDSVRVLDMYWNPRSDVQWQADRAVFDLNEEPAFIMDQGLGEEKLRAALAAVTVAPPAVGIELALVPGEAGPVALAARFTNHTQQPIKGGAVDFRNRGPTEPFSVAGLWLLPTPVAKVPDLAPGQTAEVRLPTVLDGRVPYESGMLRAYFRAADGLAAAGDDTLWMLPAAARQPPTVDGQLADWDFHAPAWLWYNWDWSPMSRYLIQLDEGGEHFSYPPYRLDARAAVCAGWDAANLYLAVRLEDDEALLDAAQGELVTVKLWPPAAPATITLRPLPDNQVTAQLRTADGVVMSLTAAARLTRQERLNGALARKEALPVISLEVAIPWAKLGVTPRMGDLLGFDCLWTDADHEGQAVAHGTLRWAGQATRCGYLLLRKD